MKTILKNRPGKSSPPASSPAGETEKQPAAAPQKFTPRGGSKNRILIAVRDERIDFQAMGAESAKTLNELMHNPDVQAQFGIGPLTQGFNPEHCKRIYEALGLVMMGGCKAMFKWPMEALEKLQYTEAEKNELKEPTAHALDELAPKWLRENQAIAALVLVFTAMTQNKLREAATVAAEIKRKQGGGTIQAMPKAPQRAPIPIVMETEKENGAAVPTAASGIGPDFGGAGPRRTM